MKKIFTASTFFFMTLLMFFFIFYNIPRNNAKNLSENFESSLKVVWNIQALLPGVLRRRSSKNMKTCSRFVAGKNPKGQKSLLPGLLLPPSLQYMSPYMNTYNHLVCGATHKASLGLLDEFSGKGRSWINPRFCGHSIARIFSEVRSIFQIHPQALP